MKHELRGAMEPRRKKECKLCKYVGGICQQGEPMNAQTRFVASMDRMSMATRG